RSAVNLTRRDLLAAAAAVTPALASASALLPTDIAEADGGRPAAQPFSAGEMQAIEQGIGKKGNFVADQAGYTVPLPRNDLKMMIQGEGVPIPFGFGGWVAFKKGQDGNTVLMSDTVLLQEEVNPVISAAQENGIEVTAIHNHFFFEEPRVFYMHVHAMG